MGRFIEGGERDQLSLLPASIEDYLRQDNPVRVVDAFVDELDLGAIGFNKRHTGNSGSTIFGSAKLYPFGVLTM